MSRRNGHTRMRVTLAARRRRHPRCSRLGQHRQHLPHRKRRGAPFRGELGFDVIETSTVFEAETPGGIIPDIEVILGWDSASNTATSRSLNHRILAAIAIANA